MNVSRRRSESTHKGFWAFFWLTLVLLAGVYVYALVQVERVRRDGQGQVSLAPYLGPRWDRVIEAVLDGYQGQLDGNIRAEIYVVIEREIDEAFAPVYGQIPKLAEVHYSLVGEYSELSAAALGGLEKRIADVLFREVEFSKRLETAVQEIFAQSGETIARSLDQVSRQIQARMAFRPEEMQLLAPALSLTLEDMEARFGSLSLGFRSAGAAGGAAAGALATKAIMEKLVAKLLGKAAIKAGAKAVTVGGGAALGAAAGSFVPGVGTALGGVLGAALVWLGTDKAVIEIDEYFNREDFEGDIARLLDEEKARIKTDLRAGYDRVLSRLPSEMHAQLEGLSPLTLIER